MSDQPSTSRQLPRRAAVGAIHLYQLFLSPLLGARCRFYPSCSSYAAEAISAYGLARGSWLAAKRLGKCHPWHPGGFDYVPGRGPGTGDTPAPPAPVG
ncbi:MAG: membrane protein insertion efficiency factor YidD [Actinomycetota bacterium]